MGFINTRLTPFAAPFSKQYHTGDVVKFVLCAKEGAVISPSISGLLWPSCVFIYTITMTLQVWNATLCEALTSDVTNAWAGAEKNEPGRVKTTIHSLQLAAVPLLSWTYSSSVQRLLKYKMRLFCCAGILFGLNISCVMSGKWHERQDLKLSFRCNYST